MVRTETPRQSKRKPPPIDLEAAFVTAAKTKASENQRNYRQRLKLSSCGTRKYYPIIIPKNAMLHIFAPPHVMWGRISK